MCDDSWDTADAQVVCRQLGYSTNNAVALNSAHFGQENGFIYIDDVSCVGTESSLFNCTYNYSYNCNHSEGSGAVKCTNSTYDVTVSSKWLHVNVCTYSL